MSKEVSSEKIVNDIRRKTRKKYSAEEKIRIVLDGLRGEESIAALCRKEGILSRSTEFQPINLSKILAQKSRSIPFSVKQIDWT